MLHTHEAMSSTLYIHVSDLSLAFQTSYLRASICLVAIFHHSCGNAKVDNFFSAVEMHPGRVSPTGTMTTAWTINVV